VTYIQEAYGWEQEINSREKLIVDSPPIFRENNFAQRHSSRHDSHAQLQHLIRHYNLPLRGTSSPLHT
jgi:hypothetical protein